MLQAFSSGLGVYLTGAPATTTRRARKDAEACDYVHMLLYLTKVIWPVIASEAWRSPEINGFQEIASSLCSSP